MRYVAVYEFAPVALAFPLTSPQLAGLGSSFPTATDTCSAQHCADVLVPFYRESFDVCQPDLLEIGATDADLEQITRLYNSW